MKFSQVTSLEIHGDLSVHSVVRGELRTTINFCDRFGTLMATILVEDGIDKVIANIAESCQPTVTST